jgi:hypothetical protein
MMMGTRSPSHYDLGSLWQASIGNSARAFDFALCLAAVLVQIKVFWSSGDDFLHQPRDNAGAFDEETGGRARCSILQDRDFGRLYHFRHLDR